MKSGRLRDVMIEDEHFFPDDPTKRRLAPYVTVYADKGLEDILSGIEGVLNAAPWIHGCTYDVYLDPRYDRMWIKAEIEAAVKCAE
jgi:hypothetical protein